MHIDVPRANATTRISRDRSNRPALATRAAAILALGAIAISGCKDSMTDPEIPFTELIARDKAALEALYNATGGEDWLQQENWLTDAPLGDWHGVVTDSTGEVTWLTLPANGLKGTLPAELGNLRALQYLGLADNQLSGPVPDALGDPTQLTALFLANNRLNGAIPGTFLQLEGLRVLDFAHNQGLCMPETTEFMEWTADVAQVIGPNCAEGDRTALKELFEETRGHGWADTTGWLGDGVLDEWFGVDIDSLGRVSALDLAENGLTGMLPEVLGELAVLSSLDVSGNGLAGELPRSLMDLPLQAFRYSGTELCVPHDAEYQEWLQTLGAHEGTGANCTPQAQREALIAFYKATDGPNWNRNDNWMTNAPISEWYGVGVNRAGDVASLFLSYNGVRGTIPPVIGEFPGLRVLNLNGNWGLSGPLPAELFELSGLRELHLYRVGLGGPLPPEIGKLTALRELMLRYTALAGPIPAELGQLVRLQYLHMAQNDLSGPIPPELGNLVDLDYLALWDNELTGDIPAELGNLTKLETLDIERNRLTGDIPATFGNLTSLEVLWLNDNALTGAIPPEFGSMSSLERAYLHANDLSGALPSELGGLTSLERFWLGNNPGLSGSLPASLKALAELENFKAGGTDLCVPADPALLAWLDGVEFQRVAHCDSGGTVVYLTQAVQSRKFPVPLVAGRPALLRVFLSSPQASGERIPPVRATFFHGGTEVHTAEITTGTMPIPSEIDESALELSANAEIPGDVIQEGLEMVIEVDPNGTLASGMGIADRIPASGRMAVDVREMPDFRLTVIPFLYELDPDSAILEITADMARDPEGSEMLSGTRDLLPIGSFDVRRHDPVLTSSDNGFQLLLETETMRRMERGPGYWLAMLSPVPTGGLLGVALGIGSWSSYSVPLPRTVAHELGHNMGLYHAPCGGAGGPDQLFPDRNGRIGSWGYDREHRRLITPHAPDLMSYCRGGWIGDYHFSNSLRHRLDVEPPAAASAPATRTLLVWGGIAADGDPFLDPSFIVDAVPWMPPPGTEYSLRGRTADGDQAFSLTFDMPEIPDIDDGRTGFVFTIPVSWTGDLASISLVGGDGSATLDQTTDSPMTILRDPVTGQVRAFLRGQEAAAMVVDGGQPGLEMLFSRGIPE